MLIARIKAFAGEESGATAIEYGLIAGLIAVAIIGSFTVLGNGLIELFNTQTANIIADQTAIIP